MLNEEASTASTCFLLSWSTVLTVEKSQCSSVKIVQLIGWVRVMVDRGYFGQRVHGNPNPP